MSKKEIFISEVESFVEKLSEEAKEYFNELQKAPFTPKGISDKGKVILKDMQDNAKDTTRVFSSKEIADRLCIGGRSVSGSMRSLIALGYVRKEGTNPVTYALTEQGLAYNLDE